MDFVNVCKPAWSGNSNRITYTAVPLAATYA